MLTYPVALGMAPVFLLLARWRGLAWKKAVRITVPSAAVAVAVFSANVAAQALLSEVGKFAPAPTLAECPFWDRALQAATVWLHYLIRTFWPVNLTPVDTVLLDHAPGGIFFISQAVIALVITGGCLGWERGRRMAGPFFCAYICLLAPMLGLAQRPHFPSDRYAALPQAVMAAALGMALLRLSVRRVRLAVMIALGGSLLCGVLLSRRQAEIWRDSERLWERIAARLGPGLPPSYVEVPRARCEPERSTPMQVVACA